MSHYQRATQVFLTTTKEKVPNTSTGKFYVATTLAGAQSTEAFSIHEWTPQGPTARISRSSRFLQTLCLRCDMSSKSCILQKRGPAAPLRLEQATQKIETCSR